MMRRWFMITCRQAHVLLSQRQDGSLGLLDRYRLRLHLSFCDWCTRISQQFKFLSDAIRRIDR